MTNIVTIDKKKLLHDICEICGSDDIEDCGDCGYIYAIEDATIPSKPEDKAEARQEVIKGIQEKIDRAEGEITPYDFDESGYINGLYSAIRIIKALGESQKERG